MATSVVGFATVDRGFNFSIIEKRVREQADRTADDILNQLQIVAVQEVETIIRDTITGDGTSSKEGARRLEGSIRARIEGDGVKAKLVVYSIDDPKKAGAIEYGVLHDYTIKAKKADKKGGRFIYFPHTKIRASKGLALVKLPEVIHHAFPGKFYMRRGVNRALRQVLRIH